MEMKKFFTDQLEREVAASSKVLDRVPEGRNDRNHMSAPCRWVILRHLWHKCLHGLR